VYKTLKNQKMQCSINRLGHRHSSNFNQSTWKISSV